MTFDQKYIQAIMHKHGTTTIMSAKYMLSVDVDGINYLFFRTTKEGVEALWQNIAHDLNCLHPALKCGLSIDIKTEKLTHDNNQTRKSGNSG